MNEFLEFLKSMLKEDADNATIQKKLAECIEKENKDKTSGLIKKRDELKAEKLKLKEELEAIQEKLAYFEQNNITPESYSDIVAELESARSSGDNKEELEEKFRAKYESGKKAKETELAPKITKLENEISKIQKDKDKAEKLLKDYRAESEIRKAVQSTGVETTPTWMRGLFSAAKVEFDDYGKMSIELPIEGQDGTIPIEDWRKAFGETKEAKRMMPARADIGGGAPGGAPGGADGPQSAKDFYSGLFKG